MTYLSLDVWGAYGWSPRRAALGRHPVAAIHSTPCAVRCVNARRHQRHKIHSSTQRARSSLRTEWRAALPLLPSPSPIHSPRGSLLRSITRETLASTSSRSRNRSIQRTANHSQEGLKHQQRSPSHSQLRPAFSAMILATLLCTSNTLQWHRGRDSTTEQHTHDPSSCSCRCAFRHTQNKNSGMPQHARNRLHFLCLDSTNMRMSVPLIALAMAFIKTGEKCRRTKSCHAHDGAVCCGSTTSEEQDQQIQGAAPTNDACLRVVSLSHRPWCFYNSKCSPALHGAASAETWFTLSVSRLEYDLRRQPNMTFMWSLTHCLQKQPHMTFFTGQECWRRQECRNGSCPNACVARTFLETYHKGVLEGSRKCARAVVTDFVNI